MGKYMRECSEGGGISELTVKEVSQFVGVKTRARAIALEEAAKKKNKKGKAAVKSPEEYHSAYLQLRNRSVIMKQPRISPSPSKTNSNAAAVGDPQISLASSNASCEVSVDSETTAYQTCSQNRRETSPSTNQRDANSEDLESTADRSSRTKPKTAVKNFEAEIEEFFAAAEGKEPQKFTNRYNYDVVEDIPLEGRYDWVAIAN